MRTHSVARHLRFQFFLKSISHGEYPQDAGVTIHSPWQTLGIFFLEIPSGITPSFLLSLSCVLCLHLRICAGKRAQGVLPGSPAYVHISASPSAQMCRYAVIPRSTICAPLPSLKHAFSVSLNKATHKKDSHQTYG